MSAQRGLLSSDPLVFSCAHDGSRAASPSKISAILSLVRKSYLPLIVLLAAVGCSLSPLRAARVSSPSRTFAFEPAAQQAPAPSQPPALSPQPQAPPAAPHPNAAPQPPPQPTPPSPPSPVIVLDSAHGGTDTGARGENGLAEKDVVLQIARTLQAQLLNHGFRVVMTRSDDSNPSYDDRAALANAYRNAIFITIHVGSSGKMGTVRAFYDQFWSPASVAPSSTQEPAPGGNSAASSANLPANSLIPWHEAQRAYVPISHRLADILQLQFAQSFPGSPIVSTAVPLRDLRSVADPAVAIEISNISASNADALLQLSGPLSVSIEKAVQTFRQSASPETP